MLQPVSPPLSRPKTWETIEFVYLQIVSFFKAVPSGPKTARNNWMAPKVPAEENNNKQKYSDQIIFGQVILGFEAYEVNHSLCCFPAVVFMHCFRYGSGFGGLFRIVYARTTHLKTPLSAHLKKRHQCILYWHWSLMLFCRFESYRHDYINKHSVDATDNIINSSISL